MVEICPDIRRRVFREPIAVKVGPNLIDVHDAEIDAVGEDEEEINIAIVVFAVLADKVGILEAHMFSQAFNHCTLLLFIPS